MRLEQYLAHCGVSSRRQAQRLIAAGRVTFNGQLASPLDRVNANAINPNILLDGAPIAPIETKQYCCTINRLVLIVVYYPIYLPA